MQQINQGEEPSAPAANPVHGMIAYARVATGWCSPCVNEAHDLCLTAIDAFDPPARYPTCRCSRCYQ